MNGISKIESVITLSDNFLIVDSAFGDPIYSFLWLVFTVFSLEDEQDGSDLCCVIQFYLEVFFFKNI